MNSRWMLAFLQVAPVALPFVVACSGSVSKPDSQASRPPSSGGSGSGGAPTAGGRVEAGAPQRAGSGGAATGSAGAFGAGGAPASGGDAGIGGAGNSGGSSTMSGGAGNAGLGDDGAGGDGAGPVHDRCADPLPLEFVNGEATVSDDTSRASDEFPTLTCGSTPEPGFRGGQIYYRFKARPGREYALRPQGPSFGSVQFYVFPAAAPCTAEAIRAACSSEGATGIRVTNTPATILTPFVPSVPGDYIVGVDTNGVKGSPFTLTIFEYCGTSGGTDCKVKGCDLELWKTCLGNTLSACNEDGTATLTTDCAMTGKSCHNGACVASVFDNIGYGGWSTSPAMTAGADGVTLLNFFEATTSRTLTELEIIMVQPKSFALDWRILESTNQAGPYQQIFTTRTTSAGAMMASSETTGPIQVPIVAGRFYATGVSLPANARYYLQQQAEKSLPLDVSFGRLTSAVVLPSASLSASVSYAAPETFLFAQGITTKL